MANWALIGFVSTAISAAALADYADQSRMAGVPLGEIGALDYVGQFGLPNKAHRIETAPPQQITAEDTRAYLPLAPAGWTRRHWSDGDNSWLHKQRRLHDEGAQTDGSMLENGMDAFMDHRDAYAQRRAFSSGWIYERGDEIIFIGAEILARGSNNSLFGRGLNKVNVALNRMNFREGYAVVDGVPYAETMHISESKRLFRSFQGRIGYGQEVRIRIRSHASKGAVAAFLNGIDHAGLNALLDQPMAGVGPDIPRLPSSVAKELAGYAFDVRDALKDMSRSEAEQLLSQGSPMQIALVAMTDGQVGGEQLSEVSN